MMSLEVDDMLFEWSSDKDSLYCSISAPCSGWVAIGFNSIESLVGSNLIMGNFSKGTSFISDRYIVGLGDHRPVETLGIKALVTTGHVTRHHGTTRMEFSIPRKSPDSCHQNLTPGKALIIWLAYSKSDDLNHHSRKRNSIHLTL